MSLIIAFLSILLLPFSAYATPFSYGDFFYHPREKVQVMRLDKETRHKILMERKAERDKIRYRGQAERLLYELSWLNPFLVVINGKGDPFTITSPLFFGHKAKRRG